MLRDRKFVYCANFFTKLCVRFESTSTKYSKTFNVEAVEIEREKFMRNALEQSRFSDHIFRLALPPPNVTGVLHLGHALTVTIEDAICRFNRLYGKNSVWIPGFDHAGIATQVVVERNLWRTKRLYRHQISPNEFLNYCNEWTNRKVEIMKKQLKKMGATLDWRKEYYTMDEKFAKAVTHAFCQLHANGYLFRDYRFVNWSPVLQSTISDQEVDHVDISNCDSISVPSSCSERRLVRIGIMHLVNYKLVGDESSYLQVATTRPETIFADIAVAVHPSDSRYSHLIGKYVINPLMPSRLLPIISDTAVVPEKGTGVLKITPAHDYTDFEIAKRNLDKLENNALEFRCIDESGKVINANEFDGIDRFDAREKVIEYLEQLNAYGGSMPHKHTKIQVCSRTGDIVEPMLKEQWFMNCEQMNENALRALSSGKLKIVPNSAYGLLEEWLKNKEPWCLSRQLLWGHRIPAYRIDQTSEWIVAENEEVALGLMDLPTNGTITLEKESDVFDTWFSSSLVPLVSSGWPDNEQNFQPLSLMETGQDIVGFWVARMITVCHSLTGRLPFENILLHGLIKDDRGRKMSKSVGNVIDPNDVIDGITLEKMFERVDASMLSTEEKQSAKEDLKLRFPNGIVRCGSDALRFALIQNPICDSNIVFDVGTKALEGVRFFNKLWNLCSYAEKVWNAIPKVNMDRSSFSPADRWIQSRLASTFLVVRQNMPLAPDVSFNALHKFILNDLCSIYIEITKKSLRENDAGRLTVVGKVLRESIEKSLLLLSVYIPFTSEYLFNRIKSAESVCMYDQNFIEGREMESDIDLDLEKCFSLGKEIVSTVRSLREDLELSKKILMKASLFTDVSDTFVINEMVHNLCNVLITSHQPFSDSLPKGSFPVLIKGQKLVLAFALENDTREHFRSRLLNQLEKSKQVLKDSEEKIAKYVKFSNEAKKEYNIEKYRRKASLTKIAAQKTADRILTLNSLLEKVDGLQYDESVFSKV